MWSFSMAAMWLISRHNSAERGKTWFSTSPARKRLAFGVQGSKASEFRKSWAYRTQWQWSTNLKLLLLLQTTINLVNIKKNTFRRLPAMCALLLTPYMTGVSQRFTGFGVGHDHYLGWPPSQDTWHHIFFCPPKFPKIKTFICHYFPGKDLIFFLYLGSKCTPKQKEPESERPRAQRFTVVYALPTINYRNNWAVLIHFSLRWTTFLVNLSANLKKISKRFCIWYSCWIF